MWFIRAGAQSGSPNVSLRGSPEALRIEAEGKRNPPFPAGCQVGAPRFELGTSSPPDHQTNGRPTSTLTISSFSTALSARSVSSASTLAREDWGRLPSRPRATRPANPAHGAPRRNRPYVGDSGAALKLPSPQVLTKPRSSAALRVLTTSRLGERHARSPGKWSPGARSAATLSPDGRGGVAG